jgi:hypothetical protein
VINESGVVAFYSLEANGGFVGNAVTGVFVAEPPATTNQTHDVRSLMHGGQGPVSALGLTAVHWVPQDISPLAGGQEAFKGGWLDQPSINCRGDVAFRASVSFTGQEATTDSVWRWTRSSNTRTPLFRIGDALPDLPDGTPVSPASQIIADFDSDFDAAFCRPAINGMGEVAVVAQIEPESELEHLCPQDDQALLLWTRDGEPVTLARTRSPQFQATGEVTEEEYQILAFGSYDTIAAGVWNSRFFVGLALNDLGQVALPFNTFRVGDDTCEALTDEWAGFGTAHRDRALDLIAYGIPIGSRLFSGGSSSDGDASLARFSGDGAYWRVDETDLSIQGPLLTGGLVADEPECGAAPSDVNDDGCVNTADLGILIGQFGCTGVCSADVNGDGVVNTADLGILLGHFGQECVGCACDGGSPESLMAGSGEAPSSPFLEAFGFEDAASYVEWVQSLTAGELERHLEDCVALLENAK